jgi:DNA-directed RNA polymerase specialized sigma24 family protein
MPIPTHPLSKADRDLLERISTDYLPRALTYVPKDLDRNEISQTVTLKVIEHVMSGHEIRNPARFVASIVAHTVDAELAQRGRDRTIESEWYPHQRRDETTPESEFQGKQTVQDECEKDFLKSTGLRWSSQLLERVEQVANVDNRERWVLGFKNLERAIGALQRQPVDPRIPLRLVNLVRWVLSPIQLIIERELGSRRLRGRTNKQGSHAGRVVRIGSMDLGLGRRLAPHEIALVMLLCDFGLERQAKPSLVAAASSATSRPQRIESFKTVLRRESKAVQKIIDRLKREDFWILLTKQNLLELRYPDVRRFFELFEKISEHGTKEVRGRQRPRLTSKQVREAYRESLALFRPKAGR